ncbi:MucBP domain-containing protein [Listeria cossartiae]|uniref:MucBP domain-containing protein n=1 Tax=Listeria cossartiae TaxID=2838249 RepID=UPI0040557879
MKAVFVDAEGNTLAETETYTGDVGEGYTTIAPNIAGYTLKTEPSNKTGVYKEEAQEVIYVYEKTQEQPVSPEVPSDPETPSSPETPSNPEIPLNPVLPGNSIKPETQLVLNEPRTILKPAKNKQSQKLASTGDEFPYDMMFSGFLLSTIGFLLLRKRK